MIRKQLKTFPEITRTQAGNCWIYTLQWVAKIPNPPRPTHVVPFDPNLHFAGRDNDNKCYSRTDIPVTAQSFKLAAEKPTNYWQAAQNTCVLARPDAPICLLPLNGNQQPNFHLCLCYPKADLPPQLQAVPEGKSAILQQNSLADTLLWLQDKPHLHLEWPEEPRATSLRVWSDHNRFTRQEWRWLGYEVSTNQQLPHYSHNQVAKHNTLWDYDLIIPAATIEEARDQLGLQIDEAEASDGGRLQVNYATIVDRAKAAKVFPFLEKLPNVNILTHSYDGDHVLLNENNLVILAKALKTPDLNLEQDQARIRLHDQLDYQRIEGYLELAGNNNEVITSDSEAARLFIPYREARRDYQIPGGTQTYNLRQPHQYVGSAYLKTDIAQIPTRNHNAEKRNRQHRRTTLRSNYPQLPKTWADYSDEAILKWQEIRRQTDQGLLVIAVDAPVFKVGLQHRSPAAIINKWLLANDPRTIEDPIEHIVYCPAYENLDELAEQANFSELIAGLFDNPLVKQLIRSEKAQSALLASLL